MDLKQHLLRQMAWSHATFGPGKRADGILEHIQKEIAEVKSAQDKSSEWVDILILALDGITRDAIFTENGARGDPSRAADRVIDALLHKQAENEARRWPDWRTSDPNKPIEHLK
jgi:hypothetical protein